MDIYSILTSKPHNQYHINRYITFIRRCQQKNVGYEGYTENHHICPKANDMFPEYQDFRSYPWNCATLTPRQHFIAHIMLWKSFPSFISQTYAIWYMSHTEKRKINSKIYEKIRNAVVSSRKDTIPVIDTSGKISGVFRAFRDDPLYTNGTYVHNTKGMIVVKDVNGNTFQTNIDDNRYKSGELVGHTKGMWVVRDENGNKFMSDDTNYVSIHKDMIPIRMPDGTIKKMNRNDPLYLSGNFISQHKDTIQVRDKNGKYFRVTLNDPRYVSGELVGSQRGKITITNGKSNRRIFDFETIPDGWERGSCKAKRYKKSIG